MNGANPMRGRRCRAHNRGGDRCGLAPIPGGRVCRFHGGAAPQVKATADARIRALVDPALDRIAALIERADSDGVGLAAARDILDRAGYAPKHQIEVTIRQQAERLAASLGLDPDELIAEAERIVAGTR